MADNDFEYHAQDLAKLKARRLREKQMKRNRYLRAYQEKLRKEKEGKED